ncbi:Caa(3)-type oxidase, subunit IV (plasmid) [Nitrobacter hamburgensis X14]|uniref:Caa(3)-type oxidase, subunit IV n=1 Tax=Nitrobacter hamburgensis (strain DSM 10229 / NCIMB 13809 / X14) TaxID=323097 RepID=Q1QG47_NITHX|nr:cytochrome C oxidase subunit IV family protein [Nitrobacter hamburgensis]ABE64800.1 Caa(3)-type oxidase, subunit IV [Nitrobacter hamburgensis X14]
MSAQTYAIWRKNGLVWLALLVLLGLTFGAARLPLGDFNVVIALAIAGIKVTLVIVIFMGLGNSPSLIRLAAAAGVFWLTILFVLTLTDVIASRQFGNAHPQPTRGEQSLSRNR